QVENLLARSVRHAHRSFDEEYAERLTVNRPAPEFRAADADDRNRGRHADLRARQFRHLARHKAERAKETKFDRSAAGGGVIYVIIERQLRLLAERQPRVVGEGDFEPRRFTGCARVAPLRVPLASPCIRLTVPIASCAAHSQPAKPDTSITATMISRCIMRRSAVGVIIAARTCSGTCSSARLA